jgi:hypothetical protein
MSLPPAHVCILRIGMLSDKQGSAKKATADTTIETSKSCYDVPLQTHGLIATSLLYEIAPDLIWGLPYAHYSLPFRVIHFLLAYRDLCPF